ncbi:MAG: hypothetical protein HY864_09765 [Chloroflexi bacterium]|nr:hypothetical protein [Chloroflexota bacterium]
MPSDAEWEGLPAPKWNNPPKPPKPPRPQRTKNGHVQEQPQVGFSLPAWSMDIPENVNLPGGIEVMTPGGSVGVPATNVSFPVPRWANRGLKILKGALNQPTIGSELWDNRNMPIYTPHFGVSASGFGFSIPSYQLNPFANPDKTSIGTNVSNKHVGATNIPTRWVRTADGYQAIPWQPGMLTGTFFSGGNAALNPPSGEDYSWTGNTRNANNDYALVTPPPTTTTTGGGGGAGGGYTGGGYRGGGGGGGGGGGYNQRVPSWLVNLYNWDFKG